MLRSRPHPALRPLVLLAALTALASGAARAQALSAGPDTTRALGEVVVGSEAGRPGVEPIAVAGALARDPRSVADVARLAPSALAQTNSRGETLLYLRGTGERQTAVLFDGAPITIPWDRRIDLALVPAGVVGRVDVVQGPASLAWGPNAAGGAVDLVPRALERAGALTEAEASGGLPARGRVAATHLRRRGPVGLSLAVDAGASGGDALAAPLAFSQAGRLRTNSDRRAASALARLAVAPRPGVEATVTLLAVDAAQGVPPEGHLDPAAERVRYWRVPDWRHATAVLSGRAPLGPLGLRATAWGSASGQTIAQYGSAAYEAVETVQTDRDRTAGARLVAETGGPLGTLRAVAYGLASEHRQREGGAPETFRHAEGRLALEAERTAGRLSALVGVAWDRFEPTDTAGRPSAGGVGSLGGVVRAEVGGPVRLHAGVARAARFPSMRELFGEALGRFALNPALRPEQTWQAEVGARREGPRAAGRVTAFARLTDGTIEQETLPDGRRQRVNLGGSRAVGVEAAGGVRRGALRLDASATLLHQRAWGADGVRVPLAERPGALGRLAATVLPPTGWTAAAEALATGPAVSLGPDGWIGLPASLQLGVRVGHRWRVGRGLLGAFLRVDNATDAVVLPQAGLPVPGREVRVGLRWLR